MKIAVLGTGNVGQTIATKLVELGHDVMMGSRTNDNEKLLTFVQSMEGMKGGTFSDAASFGEIVFNCTSGKGSLEALNFAGAENLANKILIDLANSLDFSNGMPPFLAVCNTTSLAEQIQEAFPATKVVKTLNTMWCGLMVNPKLVNNGDHNVFLSGNDDEAKSEVRTILQSFDWQDDNIVDLGDLSSARGTEMYLPLWLRMYGANKTSAFNIKIVK